MVFGSREMVSGHRSMVLPGSDMPSALGLVLVIFQFVFFFLIMVMTTYMKLETS